MNLRLHWLCLVVCMCAAITGSIQAQNKDGEAKDDAKLKGRLPPYFVPVVNEAQRKRIYALQSEYNPKIDALEEQIEKLKAERDKAIDAVLTAEQLAEVNKRRTEAKEKLQQLFKDRAKAKEAAKTGAGDEKAEEFFEKPKGAPGAAPAKPAAATPAPGAGAAPK